MVRVTDIGKVSVTLLEEV